MSVEGRSHLAPAVVLLLLLGGCPKRQTTRIVYAPAPPPAASTSSPASSGALVIEEPAPAPAAPPEIEQQSAPQAEPPTTTAAPHRPPRPIRSESGQTESAPDTQQAPVPALKPSRSAPQPEQVTQLQGEIQRQIGAINESRLNSTDRKTLADARAFLGQSQQALSSGDLLRAWSLANKAKVLADALKPGL